jgi:hypothetical protein
MINHELIKFQTFEYVVVTFCLSLKYLFQYHKNKFCAEKYLLASIY